MVTKVVDTHTVTGLTKAPVIPVPNVNVSDVESTPDPDHVDADSETIDAPDST